MQATLEDLDPVTHAQVAGLLGARRAAEMLGILGEGLARLDGLPIGDLASPAGLAAVHRLKSESGMMGFERLSDACRVVDAAGTRGTVPRDDLTRLREAIAAALRVIGTLRDGRGPVVPRGPTQR